MSDAAGLNADRQRWHGLRIGDLVEERAFGSVLRGRVIELHPMNNNAAYIAMEKGDKPFKVVAEWCDIIEKAPDQ